MPAQRNAVRLGATLIAVFLLFFAIVLWLPQTVVGGPARKIRVRFPQALPLPPLQEGSKVLVAGRPVGHVARLSLEEMPASAGGSGPTDLYLVVTARIDERLRLRKDCRIRAVGEVLGGAGSLTIDVGSDPQPADLDAVLDGDPPGGFGAYLEALGRELDGANPRSLLGQIKTQMDPAAAASLMAKLHRSMDDLNDISRRAAVELDADQKRTLLAKLHETMDGMNAATAALREEMAADRPAALLGKTHAAFDALNAGLRTVVAMLEENRRPLHESVLHVQSTADKLDTRIAESIAQQTDIRNEAGLAAKLNLAMDRLNRAMSDVGDLTSTTRDVIVLNRENLNRLLVNFKETSDHLKSAAKYILRHPWRLFNKPDATEAKQQAIFDAARNFADAATRLEDASAQLRALADLHQGRIPADDEDLARLRVQLQQTFEKFQQAEKSLWTELGVR